MKGKFIVFEGPDRSGKSTQASMLSKALSENGFDVVLTREPGGDQVAEQIRNILLNPDHNVSDMAELFLYEAARAQHTQQKIIPALMDGKIVICERYTMSTCAYQGYGRGIDMKIINQLNSIATLDFQPDLTLVFLMSDKYFTQRGEYLFSDRLEQEDEAFRHKMRQGYREIAQKTPNAVVVDADRPVKEIWRTVLDELVKHDILTGADIKIL
ncbi:MAG: dTMP kinase [Elusimicrobiota bacterium]|jgi:dTMP kinase|nr:dTMP kinase [Elusimicrobiota bacterium]